ncbi:Cystine/glutamate transporter [Holothuria leucospilota]|uniref:Cystine/glutamate transporter n=1 Tax=Holothuria leucospilota TaxID=206669 RepID=A0A9Q1CBE4_HOLLE|nr:Cystine/glutamate transporter [Holothuria leucospilota]
MSSRTDIFQFGHLGVYRPSNWNKTRNVSTSTTSLFATDANCNTSLEPDLIHVTENNFQQRKLTALSSLDEGRQESLSPPKVFGLSHSFAIVLGSVLTESILFSVNGVHSGTGGLVPALLVWFCCGAISFVGAQCYAEITTTIAENGGEFILIYRTLNPMPAFMQIWFSLLAGTTMVSVTLAMLFSEYAFHVIFRQYGLDLPSHLLKLVAALQLSAVFFLHCVSTKLVARFQVILTSLKFICLSIILVAAVRYIFIGQGVNLPSELMKMESVDTMNILRAFSAASPVLLGWKKLTFVAAEIQNLERNVPLSMSISTILSTIIAICLHLAFAVVLSDQELQADTPVIVLFAVRTMGPLAPLGLLLIMIQALCSMNTGILAGTRTLWAAARESMSPEFWAMLHIHRLSYVPAALTLMTISMPMLFIEKLEQLLFVLGMFRWFPPLLVSAALLAHRWKFPDAHRPFKVPLVFPFILIAFCLLQTVVTFIQHPLAMGICVIGILPAFPLFLFLVKLRRPAILFKLVEKATLFLQKVLLVAHDLKKTR